MTHSICLWFCVGISPLLLCLADLTRRFSRPLYSQHIFVMCSSCLSMNACVVEALRSCHFPRRLDFTHFTFLFPLGQISSHSSPCLSLSPPSFFLICSPDRRLFLPYIALSYSKMYIFPHFLLLISKFSNPVSFMFSIPPFRFRCISSSLFCICPPELSFSDVYWRLPYC